MAWLAAIGVFGAQAVAGARASTGGVPSPRAWTDGPVAGAPSTDGPAVGAPEAPPAGRAAGPASSPWESWRFPQPETSLLGDALRWTVEAALQAAPAGFPDDEFEARLVRLIERDLEGPRPDRVAIDSLRAAVRGFDRVPALLQHRAVWPLALLLMRAMKAYVPVVRPAIEARPLSPGQRAALEDLWHPGGHGWDEWYAFVRDHLAAYRQHRLLRDDPSAMRVMLEVEAAFHPLLDVTRYDIDGDLERDGLSAWLELDRIVARVDSVRAARARR